LQAARAARWLVISKTALKACPVRELLWGRHCRLLSIITDH